MEIDKPLRTPATPTQMREDVAKAEAGPSQAEVAQWEGLEQTPEFRQLVQARLRFVLPATVFFLVYYFLLPLLNGLAPSFMRTNVFGQINIAYLFALSQFVVAWFIAYLYIRQANRLFDPLAEKVRQRAARGKGSAS
jgi:uncharacterized membrane protein (DUF485 family)